MKIVITLENEGSVNAGNCLRAIQDSVEHAQSWVMANNGLNTIQARAHLMLAVAHAEVVE